MAITIFWKNINKEQGKVDIYRSTTPIDPANPGSPITTITDGSTKYVDNVPKIGESFYYLLSITIGGKTIYSDSKKFTCLPDLGPGGNKILTGTPVFGYMGEVSVGDIGISPTLWALDFPVYHKFIHNGRIIYTGFMPRLVSMAPIIDNKVFNTGVESFNISDKTRQYGEVVEINNRRFAPRVAKLYDYENKVTDITKYSTNLTSGNPMGTSELLDLMSVFIGYNNEIIPQNKKIISLNSVYSFSSSTVFISSDLYNTAGSSCISVKPTVISSVTNTSNSITTTTLTGSAVMTIPVIEYLGER